MSTYNSSKKTTQPKVNSVFLTKSVWFGKAVKIAWILFLCIVLGLPLYIFAVSVNPLGLFGEMPSLRAIENPQNDLSSELISADGVSLGSYFTFNRSQVTFEQLSPNLVNTLLLSEDHRFYDHAGMDFWAYPRVFWGLLTFNSAGGGSTITQQLAKNLFTINPELDGHIAKMGKYPKRIVQKTKEWIISIHLEKNFTKEEIIAMYLNTNEFSSNAYGIKVAAETYFGKQPDSLNIQESAVLVGMCQNPSLYNPKRNPNTSLRKRNEVLRKLLNHGFIKTEEYDSLKVLPIELRFSIQSHNQGLATYFRTVLRNDLMAWCKEHGYDLWESGLKIHTTIDSRMQQFAEEAMEEHMAVLQARFEEQWKLRNSNPWVDEETGHEVKNFLQKKIRRQDVYKSLVDRYGEGSDSIDIMLNLKKPMTVFSWKGERDTVFSTMDSLKYYNKFLQAGFMSMDPETGAIKAWVGGINHKYFKYDHVKLGTRQPGSTFKPFVYGKAIEDGYSPCFELLDISPTIKVSGGTWYPDNAEPPYKGTGQKVNLRQAMARSINSISAQLIAKVEPVNVANFAKRLGITSHLVPVHSLCLGTSDVSLFEMVSAYCSFVNLGIHIDPYYITRIEDKHGNVIQSFVPNTRQAMDDKTAYKMVYMLQGGVTEAGGTSGGISAFLKQDNEIGGKTGTTDNASDGWYMGVTHNLVTGVWVGGDERNIHFPSWSFGAGSKSARPIWDKYMVKVYEHPEVGYPKGSFKRPTSLDMTLDCSQYVSQDSTIVVEDEITLDDINN